ncbi:nucleotidyltransferase [Lujinxingia vulgaris]|uniref:Nucleotidyltransferase n=1 Tax=Lujinxingia vulgaris TaxID=2600176 RepID=A0A5C6X9D1_9DELT|nr:NTP transferase domain-containing protein [Lujinxingia vulgaris]TXD33872.1 nucleotidyltransferase [Lujinxingia vulgaris]
MPQTTRAAVILAAGFGSRLNAEEGYKLLAEVGGRPMIDHHLAGLHQLGVAHVVVVTGYAHEGLEDALQKVELPEGMRLHCAFNPNFEGQNGTSVLVGAAALRDAAVPGPFWLTMSDHLFEPVLFDDLRAFDAERPSSWQGALMIDRKLETIFDMPDATKLAMDAGDFAIGKELTRFDAVDAGLFWCDEGFVDALVGARERRGDCSTSDAVRALHAESAFGFWDIGPRLWQDVDTPGARAHAERLIAGWRAHQH